ncbi:MAG: YqgE/AlgH family protein, partial [Sandaracinobacteroides sp.]
GWGAGQLEQELVQHGWFTTPATLGLIWETEVCFRWLEAYRAAGIDARLLSADAGHA